MKYVTLALAMFAYIPAMADHKDQRDPASRSYYAYADVIDVEPIIKHRVVSRPREVCEDRDRYARHHHEFDHEFDEPRHPDYGPARSIFGGLIGGWIGHQFGGGHGKQALTILGALAGSSIAKDSARRNYRSYRYAQDRHRRGVECWTVNDEDIVKSHDGYRVTYTYQGRSFVKHMNTYPDDQIRVRVRVSPDF